jgi:hypothetical protein
MPVTFPDKALAINDAWTFDDGLLGKKPGRVTYKGRLVAVTPATKGLAFHIGQSAEATIDDKRDKDGKPTDKTADAVDTTSGKVNLTGSLNFVAVPAATGVASHAGRVAQGNLKMVARIKHKRTIPDPDHPDDPLESNIDVTASLSVVAQSEAKKTTALAPNGGHK